MKVLVLGYYYRNNLGDDSYIESFTLFLRNANISGDSPEIEFKSIDDIPELIKHSYEYIHGFDAFIIGGGDIFNDYFLPKIAMLRKKTSRPIIALSVGFPFPSYCNRENLNLFDYIYTRNYVDLDFLRKLTDAKKIRYLPDISLLIEPPMIVQAVARDRSRPRLGICFPGNLAEFPQVVQSLANILSKLAVNYDITLLVFDYSKQHFSDDRILYNEILKLISDMPNSAETLLHLKIRKPSSVKKMLIYLKKFDLVISARYHGIIFSLISQVPVIPILLTRKIILLSGLIGITDYAVSVLNDSRGKPLKFSSEHFISRIEDFIDDEEQAQVYLINKEAHFYKKSVELLNTLAVHNYMNIFIEYLIGKLNVGDRAELLSYYLTGIPDSVYTWGLLKDLKRGISEQDCVSWITQDMDLNKQVTSVPIIALGRVKEPIIKYCIDPKMYQTFDGLHRSGWADVFKCLNTFSVKNGVYLDTYVDRTFHWCHDFYRSIGEIPYLCQWYGFIHHPWKINNSDYSSSVLFKKKAFITSLYTCKGLFVFSEKLKNELLTALEQMQFYHVPVHVLNHPTETFELTKFSMSKFDSTIISIGGWLRRTLDIFLSNISDTAITHKLALQGKKMSAYLPPKNIEFIHACDDDSESTHSSQSSQHSSESTDSPKDSGRHDRKDRKHKHNRKHKHHRHRHHHHHHICRHECCNHVFLNELGEYLYLKDFVSDYWYDLDGDNCKFYLRIPQDAHSPPQKLIRMLNKLIASVGIQDTVSNDEYDDILSKKVVLLSLHDCVGCNTLVECIVRATPVLVSRLPAVEALLGKEYPLYFDSITNRKHARKLLTTENIAAAHKYLKNLDVSRFEFETFMDNLHCLLD